MAHKIGLIGYGRWGKNWARVLNDLGSLAWIQDNEIEVAAQACRDYPYIPTLVAGYGDCDGVVVATPPHSHAEVAQRFLYRGIPTLVEKPLAQTPASARYLRDIAIQEDIPLLVGHTFLYQKVVQEAKRIVDTQLGRIHAIDFNWLQFGAKGREQISALWNLGPHPVSIASYLLSDTPEMEEVSVFDSIVNDRSYFHCYTEEGIRLSFDLSHMYNGRKVREFIVYGENGVVYCSPRDNFLQFTSVKEDREYPWTVEGKEPLLMEAGYFLYCITSGHKPDDGNRSIWCVDLLNRVDSYG